MSYFYSDEEEYLDHCLDLFINNSVCVLPIEFKNKFENIISRFEYTTLEYKNNIVFRKRGIK